MFRLLNADSSKLGLKTEIFYKDESVKFELKYLINKKDKTDINPSNQYRLLNAYLDYKGDVFKSDLIKLYKQAYIEVTHSTTMPNLTPLPVHLVHNILNFFNLEDVKNFIINIYGVKAPSVLRKTYDIDLEASGHGTRVQTYIIDEYYDLAAVATILKTVLPVIAQFGIMNSFRIDTAHKEYVLYNFLKGTYIDNSPAVIKIKGFVNKHIENILEREETAFNIAVMESNMPAIEYNNYLSAMVILQKISIANIVLDSDNENIISKMYTFIINKLKPKDGSKKINIKKVLRDADSNDPESILESYRGRMSITPGLEVELDWSVSNIDNIRKMLPVDVDDQDVNDGIKSAQMVLNNNITDEHIYIIAIVFKNIIDPRGIAYVSYNSMVNIISLSYAVLIKLGMYNIAAILTSIVKENDEDTVVMSSTVNKTRLPKEYKAKLQELFPYNRVKNKEVSVNIVEESINTISNNLSNRLWVSTNIDMINKYNIPMENIVPNNIKTLLAEFIIGIEELNKK